MLNFRNTTVGFLVMLALFSVLSMYTPLGYVLLLILSLAYLISLVFGAVFVCSGFYLEAFCRKATQEKVIALTFDDGPHAEVTPKVMDILKKHGIPAMFFVIGKQVIENQPLMERMVREGHAVGNHSYAHATLFDLWGSKQMQRDLTRAEEVIALATGKRPLWFRPPYGVTNPTVAITVNNAGYKVMGWSIRSLDTSTRDAGRIAERIKRRWHTGGIILLHDTNDRVTEVLEKVIAHAKAQGYRFVRADRM